MTSPAHSARALALFFAGALFLAACGERTPLPAAESAASEDFERGPHNGRLLRDGAFALEITVFETGVEPELRVYPFADNRPLAPGSVQLAIQVSRLDGEINRFGFTPQQDFLRADGVLEEPHSFDVAVAAQYGGQTHNWTYASYEGRTTIPDAISAEAGVRTERAGPADMEETIRAAGRIELQPQGRSEVRAVYPGRIVSMTKIIGQPVRRGETIARVESSSSLQTYAIAAPIAGIVIQRNANAGDIAADTPIYVISDSTQVHAELFLFPGDAERVEVGQEVGIRSVTGMAKGSSRVEVLLPYAEPQTQTLMAHVELPNEDGMWRPGMGIEGTIVVARDSVPLAVRTRALQRFRDFTVVYAKVGETYEVRMLELGRQTPEWTEVLGGLKPGTEYVTDNAFLIRADVEKSGATHDH